MSHPHRRKWLIERINEVEGFEIRTSSNDPIVREYKERYLSHEDSYENAVSEIADIMNGLKSDGFVSQVIDPLSSCIGKCRHYVKIKNVVYA